MAEDVFFDQMPPAGHGGSEHVAAEAARQRRQRLGAGKGRIRAQRKFVI